MPSSKRHLHYDKTLLITKGFYNRIYINVQRTPLKHAILVRPMLKFSEINDSGTWNEFA